MNTNGIIGREYEQKLILERCKSSKAELIAIYGLWPEINNHRNLDGI